MMIYRLWLLSRTGMIHGFGMSFRRTAAGSIEALVHPQVSPEAQSCAIAHDPLLSVAVQRKPAVP